MYEINFVINHNLVYLHNVILGYVREIANRKKKHDELNIKKIYLFFFYFKF
jgi:hypothetical protein